ncbi:DNA polymerase III subunit delta [Pelagibacterium lentulum]|uniref:DNA-directed DNA polymerase n=1 Tax=Pelagibacterium lentulum TaxID=2029865 RepID=A0A916R6D8_9HYPH|nr:DNA polymerase III subunit delta [Pelagibacterium lentulum]GGA37282.1 DNA polymerase III subunit delta [Pelagibacterium lentulum]
MTALKGRQIDAFLTKPDLSAGLVLVYGPDGGLVSENAALVCRQLAEAMGGDRDAVISLHMSEVEADPQRLGIEARTPSLFGGGRVIRIRGASNKLSATLEELLSEGADVGFVVEAGDLKPADSLRKLAEKRADSRALPCYADNDQAIDALIRKSFAEANIQTEPDLVPMLRDMLGNDRQVTRREIEKLVLFAGEGGTLNRDDVVALCGDNAALAIDAVVDAIGTGHAKKFDDALTRAMAAGTDAQRLLIVSLGHFSRLRAMRAERDMGASSDQIIAKAIPRIHFSRKSVFEQQLRVWSDESLASACARLALAVGEVRKNPALANAAARQAMLAVCLAAARR